MPLQRALEVAWDVSCCRVSDDTCARPTLSFIFPPTVDGDKPHSTPDEDETSCATAEASVSDVKDGFNRYVRGLCVVCNEGSFDQMLDMLLRAYSVARGDCTITRNEMAAILAKHVIYDDSEVCTPPFIMFSAVLVFREELS